MEIKIYTDGACVGNPGPGGWAAIILAENEKKELLRPSLLDLDFLYKHRQCKF